MVSTRIPSHKRAYKDDQAGNRNKASRIENKSIADFFQKELTSTSQQDKDL